MPPRSAVGSSTSTTLEDLMSTTHSSSVGSTSPKSHDDDKPGSSSNRSSRHRSSSRHHRGSGGGSGSGRARSRSRSKSRSNNRGRSRSHSRRRGGRRSTTGAVSSSSEAEVLDILSGNSSGEIKAPSSHRRHRSRSRSKSRGRARSLTRKGDTSRRRPGSQRILLEAQSAHNATKTLSPIPPNSQRTVGGTKSATSSPGSPPGNYTPTSRVRSKSPMKRIQNMLKAGLSSKLGKLPLMDNSDHSGNGNKPGRPPRAPKAAAAGPVPRHPSTTSTESQRTMDPPLSVEQDLEEERLKNKKLQKKIKLLKKQMEEEGGDGNASHNGTDSELQAQLKKAHDRIEELENGTNTAMLIRLEKQLEDSQLQVTQKDELLAAQMSNLVLQTSRVEQLESQIQKVYDETLPDLREQLEAMEMEKKQLLEQLETERQEHVRRMQYKEDALSECVAEISKLKTMAGIADTKHSSGMGVLSSTSDSTHNNNPKITSNNPLGKAMSCFISK